MLDELEESGFSQTCCSDLDVFLLSGGCFGWDGESKWCIRMAFFLFFLYSLSTLFVLTVTI